MPTLLSITDLLSQLAKVQSEIPDRATVTRWITLGYGRDHIRLEAEPCGAKWLISMEAYTDFQRKIKATKLRTRPTTPTTRQPTKAQLTAGTEADIRWANEVLDKAGV
ncbi:MAG: hypothetical protein ABFD89_03700 [Bryobacteraceae bacterium]